MRPSRTSSSTAALSRGATLAALIAAGSLAASPVSAADGDGSAGNGAGPFGASRTRISLLIGSGWAAGDSYLILGVGIGYFLVGGLELAFDYEAWLFNDPTLHRISPNMRYVFDLGALKPYVGPLYRHTFVADYDDFDQLGVRGGLIFVPQRGAFVGAGAVYERLLDCDDSTPIDCDSVYPEITVGVAF